MGSTGSIKSIIEYLSKIKMRKNYNFLQIGRLFDKIIEQWKDMTVFVKSGDNVNNVLINCRNKIQEKKDLFFVFAYGSAVIPAISAIAQLNISGDLRGYIFTSEMQNPKEETGGEKKEIYSCIFENVEGFGIDYFV